MNYIGIDVGGTGIKGALVDENGALVREYALPTPAGDAVAVADTIAAVIEALCAEGDRAAIGALGIGCPGTVDDESGTVLFAGNLPWQNYPLREEIRVRTGFSARLCNDANAAALAEALIGAGRGSDGFVAVTLGTGVGGGVVVHGKLLTGWTGAASEMGHMVIRKDGEPCTCGRRGCFEAYASATALIRDTKRAMERDPKSLLHTLAAENGGVDGTTAFLAKERGDRTACAVVENYIDALACGLANIINIFFPETVALSGGIANQGETLLAPLRKRVEALTFASAYAKRHTKLVGCSLGYRAGMIGAALFAKEN